MNTRKMKVKVLCLLSMPFMASLTTFAADAPAPTSATTTATTITATTTSAASTVVAPLATKTVWATGLRQPHGIGRDADGNIYITEYQGGQIAKFSPDGKLVTRLGTDLKSPSWIIGAGRALYVAERKGNRILKLHGDGSLAPVGDAVAEPIGMALDAKGRLIAISHTTSRVFVLDMPANVVTGGAGSVSVIQKFVPLYVAAEGKRYGYRCVAIDEDGSLLISDETDGTIRLLTPGGRMTTWASGLDSPTAIVIAPDKRVYALEEGAGRLVRLDANGQPTVVAEGLGRARGLQFVDAQTALVSDRETGTIYQLKLR